jgi:hypothetical protein
MTSFRKALLFFKKGFRNKPRSYLFLVSFVFFSLILFMCKYKSSVDVAGAELGYGSEEEPTARGAGSICKGMHGRGAARAT